MRSNKDGFVCAKDSGLGGALEVKESERCGRRGDSAAGRLLFKSRDANLLQKISFQFLYDSLLCLLREIDDFHGH